MSSIRNMYSCHMINIFASMEFGFLNSVPSFSAVLATEQHMFTLGEGDSNCLIWFQLTPRSMHLYNEGCVALHCTTSLPALLLSPPPSPSPPSPPSLSLPHPSLLFLIVSRELVCPKCRAVTVLSEVGVDALPINWDLMVCHVP